MLLYLLIIAPFMLLGFWAQRRVGSTFREWSQVRSTSGRTGAEVARAMLDRNGLLDVQVLATPGELSDHYDPRARTVNLSEPVYGSNSVAAVSVAAHEVGHAIQHAKAYAPFQARAAVFPAASFGSAAFMPLMIIGIMLAASGSILGSYALLAAVIAFSFGVLFQLVTLPVEFDASRRARVQLTDMALAPTSGSDAQGTAKVLNAAALTYVVAALAAVVQLLYFAMQFLGSRE